MGKQSRLRQKWEKQLSKQLGDLRPVSHSGYIRAIAGKMVKTRKTTAKIGKQGRLQQ